jgi:DNA-binding SARP family transcriptional activator/predicted ATPase
MAPLTIRLLGSPEITVDQRPLSFRTRKVLALLIYLVTERGMHSRESLMALLWPESAAEQAAVTLRVTLSRLRRSLKPAGKFLMSGAGKVGFDLGGSIDLDLDWLETAVRPEKPAHDLTNILNLDRGEFLAGFSLPDAPEFDNWAAIQRQACQRQVETVYDRLTQHLLAIHESDSAVEAAAHWVARAPLSEVAYRRLMAAQALGGDRSGALKTYDQCQLVLQEEFGIDPARETTTLAEHIAQGRVIEAPVRQIPRQATSQVRRSTTPNPNQRNLPLLLPFVGRTEEHNQLVKAFHQTVKNGVQAVVLIGTAGAGKTRLVNTFQEWALLDSPGAEVWQGRAFETGGHLPYQPVIEAMRLRLEQENAPEDLLDDVWLAELSQLIPELRARYPDLPAPMTGEATFVRSRLFAAIATLGSALAARHPAVFVLDDMQWTDADTRDLVHYIARRWAESSTPILLLLTVRQESFAADAALREWLTNLGRDVPLRRLLLDTLSGTAVQQLVDRLADPSADEEATQAFGAWLWAETHGLPFFIEALLHMLVAEGILVASDTNGQSENRHAGCGCDFAAALIQVKSSGQVLVPPGVREAIRTRLERLSVNAAELLLAAAVLGRECSFEHLRQVADLSEADALQALEGLLDVRLLTEGKTARRPYMLAHDYIREVVYSENREARRRVFHRRALLAVEADRAPAAECAFHAVASLLDEPAFRFSLAAGDEALRSYAFQESLAHYDRAREAAQRMNGTTAVITTQSWLQLYKNRGRALELAGDYEAAQDNYQELLGLATASQDRTLELAALTAQCIVYATHTPIFNPPKARELGQAALNLAHQLNDRAAKAEALWCMMLVEFHSGGDRQKVFAYGQQALSHARELGLKELQGYVLSNLSWAYLTHEQLDAARKTNSEAQSIWEALGNLPMVADSYTIKLAIHRFAGEYRAVLATGPEALRLSQSIGNPMHQDMALLLMGGIHCLQGQLDQAFANFEAAMAIGEDGVNSLLAQGHFANLIPAYLLAGALDQAEQLADKLYAMRENFLPVFQTQFFVNIARTKTALGKLRESEAILERAFNDFKRTGASSFAFAPLLVTDAHLQWALGNPQGVLDRTEEAIRRLRQADGRIFLAEALWLQGRTYLSLEKTEQAEEALLQAKLVAEQTGERSILWQILGTFSELERRRGNEGEAERLRVQAQEIINYIAEHTGSEKLRGSFVARTDVRRLITPSPALDQPT